MSAGRVFGGIIALIAGIFILTYNFAFVDLGVLNLGGDFAFAWFINLIVAAFALIGGILGLASKNGGGVALLAGILALVLGIIGSLVVPLSVMFFQYSLFSNLTHVGPWYGITLEEILMLLGGIIMLASSSKE